MTTTRKILICLIAGTLVFEVLKFYSYFQEYSGWQYADWLINYQGGLVRRGLIGEILFKFHKISTIDLDILILLFVNFLYLILSYFLIKSVKYIENSRTNILIFLSPGFFLYPVMNSEIVGRKDILLLAFISSFVFLEEKINKKYHFIILILTIIFLSLSHSGFVFYTPYLIFLYLLIKFSRKQKIKIFEITTTITTLILLFFFITFFKGSYSHINEICASVKNFASDRCGQSDQIYWLAQNLEGYILEKSRMGANFIAKNFLIYFVSTVFVYLFISLKFYNSKFNVNYLKLNKLNPFLILLFLFFLTLPVYIIGLDWGRYIYISYSCSFFIFIYCIKKKLFKNGYDFQFNKFKSNKYFFLLFVVFYSFIWTFPFYNATNFKLVLKNQLFQS